MDHMGSMMKGFELSSTHVGASAGYGPSAGETHLAPEIHLLDEETGSLISEP